MIPLIQLDYHRPGKGTTVFREWLILDRPDVKVLLLERYEKEAIRHGDSVMLASGAPVVWYVFTETWHDIGRFHDAQGNFTGWYTNICTPIEIDGDRWKSPDLFLDLWQPVAGEPVWLDDDELADAVKRGVIDRATRKRIQNERVIIDFQLSQGAWPPPIARDIDLAQAVVLKES